MCQIEADKSLQLQTLFFPVEGVRWVGFGQVKGESILGESDCFEDWVGEMVGSEVLSVEQSGCFFEGFFFWACGDAFGLFIGHPFCLASLLDGF